MSCRNSFDTSPWVWCDPGTLQELAERLRTARRRNSVRQVVTSSIVLVAMLLGTWTTSRMMKQHDSYYGGISCSEVQDQLKMYAAGLLSDELSSKMAAHLRECSLCRSLLHEVGQQQPDEVRTVPLIDHSMLASMSLVR